jgi:hypothetical protein
MRQKQTVTLPPWAVSRQEIDSLELPIGFVKDFIDYVSLCTDAPSSFALGTGLGILAVACGRCTIVIKGDSPGLEHTAPIRLWQALLGSSGQRKSKVMDLGINILQKTGYKTLLPDDGSMEALHDTMIDNPITLLNKEELSSLFSTKKRSYSANMPEYFLKLWSGNTTDRTTKGGGLKTIERPRLNILGAIPPSTFFEKTTPEDWNSGFLARFLYWGGVREEWADQCMSVPRKEACLAEQLKCVHFESDADVVIPNLVNRFLSNWIFESVESVSDNFPDNVYSALTRLQEAGQVIASLLAMSRVTTALKSGTGQRHIVAQEDMEAAIRVLNLCRRSIESIGGRANKTQTSVSEDRIVNYLRSNSDGFHTSNLVNKLGMSHSILTQHLNNLIKSDIVTSYRKKLVGAGRPRIMYKLIDESGITP